MQVWFSIILASLDIKEICSFKCNKGISLINSANKFFEFAVSGDLPYGTAGEATFKLEEVSDAYEYETLFSFFWELFKNTSAETLYNSHNLSSLCLHTIIISVS